MAETLQIGTNYVVSNFRIGLETGTSNLYAVWTWNKDHTDKYTVVWKYYTGDGVWFIGNESDVEDPSTSSEVRVTYGIPANAKKVSCTVTPISETYEKTSKGKKNGTAYEVTYQAPYWKADPKTEFYTVVIPQLPETPSTPTVSIEQYVLTAQLDTYDVNTKSVQFEVVKDDSKVYTTGIGNVRFNHVKFTCKIVAGSQYKVRARGLKPITVGSMSYKPTGKNPSITALDQKEYECSEWSQYSSAVSTIPLAPAAITRHKVNNSTSVTLYWKKITTGNVTGYTIEYATSKMFFDHSTEVKSQSVNINTDYMYITGLDTGMTWYFRLKATNAQGDSGWSEPYSILLGVIPAAPTTWSQTSTAIAGEDVLLYWVHNSQDGSSQTAAQVQIRYNNGAWSTVQPTYLSTEDGEASYYRQITTTSENSVLQDNSDGNILDSSGNTIDTHSVHPMSEGMLIEWRVRTKGVLASPNNGYSDWSAIRTVVVYSPPTIDLAVNQTGSQYEVTSLITAFPIYIIATAYPNSQRAIGWDINVVANESYETVDHTGRCILVKEGESLYSEYIPGNSTNYLTKIISAGDIDFLTDITYTVDVKVSMNSGLIGEASHTFGVSWTDQNLWPNAEVAIDGQTLCAYIRPFCVDDNEELISNVMLAVYRRDYDGRFVEIASGIENDLATVITDPHPSLDYARYRIVATSTETGQIGYYDLPGEKVGLTSIVIQWDDEWQNFNVPSGDSDGLADPVWAGSMIQLPFNIKVSESTDVDSSLVEYIGRSSPVSYYGTQLGISGSWTSEFPATDVELRYALRRLAVWQGDAYVREPGGIGYWAKVNVSMNKDYDNLLIPVTLSVTRVEGGI